MLSRLSTLCTRCAQSRSFLVPARTFYITSLNAARTNFGRSFGQQGVGLRVMPTLRERLLGPTTGKPFIIGSYAVAAASFIGIGALCYYGLGLSKGGSALTNSVFWPQYVRDRLKFTYGYLASSLGVTAAAAVAATRSPTIMRFLSQNSLMAFFVSVAAVVASGMLVQGISYDNTVLKHTAWLVHTALLGAVVAPLCVLGGPILIRAAWYTAGITAGLSFTAMSAPSEKFLMWSGPLAMGLGVIFTSCIGSFFFPPTTALGASLTSIIVYGGLILFSAFLLHDTQRLIKTVESYPLPTSGRYVSALQAPPFDPINAQIRIYMDVLNIFIRLAMILGSGGNRKR